MRLIVEMTGTPGVKRREVEVVGGVKELLAVLGVSRQEYLVAVNDEIVSMSTDLHEGDRVVLVRAVTGG